MSDSSSEINETERDVKTFGTPDITAPEVVNHSKTNSKKTFKKKRNIKHEKRARLYRKILNEMEKRSSHFALNAKQEKSSDALSKEFSRISLKK
jgi:hypothetical protein